MKIRVVLFIFLVISFISCKKSTELKSLPPFTKDEINGEKLWDRVTIEENYKKYPTWPNRSGFQPGRSPHGRLHKSFINSTLRDALPIKEKVAPIGSIIVKENYTAGKELVAYTIMVKVKDYDPANNDWFWAKYDKEGSVDVEGRLKRCADCHVAANNDYIVLWKLDKNIQ